MEGEIDNFKSLNELKEKIKELKLYLPFEENIDILKSSLKFGRFTCPNRLVVHPMEGCDADEGGAPTELTYRRYRRFASGGAGLLWFEATPVVPEGRANPRQLYLNDNNLGNFERLVQSTKKAAKESMGPRHEPILILQLTHSGRYSKSSPIITHYSKVLDSKHKISKDYPLVSDEYLDRIQNSFIKAAKLSAKAGFHGIDIKSCHGYLISELLASFTRENSCYGGSFENRTRLVRTIAQRIRSEVPELEVTCRLNIFDGITYPYGFGVSKENPTQADLKEPIRLLDELKKIGVVAISAAIGNPYFNPYLERPSKCLATQGDTVKEHPLESMFRFIDLTRQLKEAHRDMIIIGAGYSWIKHYFPYLAAAIIKRNWVSMAGLGRGALAYPDFARDIIEKGVMEEKKTCITCSVCSKMMKGGGPAGCVVRDSNIYGPIYRKIKVGG